MTLEHFSDCAGRVERGARIERQSVRLSEASLKVIEKSREVLKGAMDIKPVYKGPAA